MITNENSHSSHPEFIKSELISKSFGPTKACNSISLTIGYGEIHGLIGENGSGKSTFASILCGVHQKDSGMFFLEGKPFEPKTIIDANNLGVSMIVQELGTLNGLTVAQNIFLGKENQFTRFGIMNQKKMNTAATRILNEYGFSYIKAHAMIDLYDFETRKLIEVVKATQFDPKIVVFDETTTALSQKGRTKIYEYINKIRTAGKSVIFISHDLDEILKITDRISIFRDGQYVTTVNSRESNENELKMLMVGRKLKSHYYRDDYDSPISDEVVLETRNLGIPNKLHDINLQLHRGEILGIGGLSDCGMHDLAKILFGAQQTKNGDVTLGNGKKIDTISDALKGDVAYTSKDRDNESIITNLSIKDNICLLSLDTLKKGIFLSDRKERDFADTYATQMAVKMENVEQFVSNLSGGNKQKVVLARWLGRNPKIFVLDSPTRGIDIKVKINIYALMDSLRKQGISIIMVSEELMELIGMCDRILILKDGRINGEFFRSRELSENDLIEKMI